MRGCWAFAVCAMTLAACGWLWPNGASAQPAREAEVLFDEGRQLKEAGRCDQALDKFLASQDLEPAVGTQLNIADCYAALGRTASAWSYFVAASNAARRTGDRMRADFARQRADSIAPRLTRMIVRVTAPKPGQVVRRDDFSLPPPLWGTPVPVDPGVYRISAEAPDHETWSVEVEARGAGTTTSITVPELVPLPAVPQPEPEPEPDAPPAPKGIDAPEAASLHPQAIGGIVVAGVGGAGLIVALALAIRARVLDDASGDYCPTDPDVCLPRGADLREDARAFQQSAIVAAAAGAAAVGVGLTVWLTAPDGAVMSGYVAPWIAADHGGATAVIHW